MQLQYWIAMGYLLFNEDVKLLLDGPLSLVKQNLCTGEEEEAVK